MKRILLLFLTITACFAAWASEGYAVYTASNTTLTFYYGTKPAGAYSLNTGYSYPEWYNAGTYATVTRVIFAPSFAQARPTSTHFWFYKMENLTTITGLNYLNTSDVTVMSNMFSDCSKLSNIDLSSFNTSKVTTMYHMFLGCKSLTSLDLSSFNTSKLSDMTMMFYHCDALTSIDLSSFNTSEVTSMYAMFSECSSLTSLNLSSFNTLKVTNMRSMFSGCSKLNNLNLSSFNTSNVKDMNGMFYDCSSLNQLNLNNFNTSNVTDMGQMFVGCSNLISLNLSSFNTSKTTNLYRMFSGCKQLTSLDLTSFNTSNVTNMSSMLMNCEKLTSLNLSSFNTSKVEKMDWMFFGCKNLKTVIVSSTWSTAAVTMSDGMFYNCTSIVGGAGTTYNSNHTDAAYAHIDGGPSNPGYFTGEHEEFDLWIYGVQVTSANCNNLSSINGVSGTVTYNPSSKTLTLDHASLSCGETNNGACIRSHIDGLTINVTGKSSILITTSGTNMSGMILSNTTITGTDTLGVSGRKSGITILSGKTLTIDNLHSLIARGSYGIYASSSTNTRLVVKGRGTNVLAIGGSGAIRNMNELVLEDGLKITEPAGGYFTGGILYDANGNVATQATISLLGDVNGDGIVSSVDVTALYNWLLNNDASAIVNGDLDGDGTITAGDIVIVYNILLGQ